MSARKTSLGTAQEENGGRQMLAGNARLPGERQPNHVYASKPVNPHGGEMRQACSLFRSNNRQRITRAAYNNAAPARCRVARPKPAEKKVAVGGG